MVDFGLRRSHVCMPIVSRRSCLFVAHCQKRKVERKKREENRRKKRKKKVSGLEGRDK